MSDWMARYMARYMQGLVGRTIVAGGVGEEGFPYFQLDDGRVIEVSRDPEGNGPGFLFGLDDPK